MRIALKRDIVALEHIPGVIGMQRINKSVIGRREVINIVPADGLMQERQTHQQHQR